MIRLAVFDLAGTTVRNDNEVTQCLLDALAAAGAAVPFADANALMGIPKPVAVRQLAPQLGEAEVEAIHQDFRRRMIEYYCTSPLVSEVEGTADAFRELRSMGVKVALDTGFDRETVEALLPRLPWDGLIDASVTSDEVERGRPFPDMIHRLMAQFNIQDPVEVAKIGDTPSDLNEGHAPGAGLNIGVTSGTHTEAELKAYPHTHLVFSVRDVPALVRAQQDPT